MRVKEIYEGLNGFKLIGVKLLELVGKRKLVGKRNKTWLKLKFGVHSSDD